MRFSVLFFLLVNFSFISLSKADTDYVYAICYDAGDEVVFKLEDGSFTEYLDVNPGRMTHITRYAGGTGIVSLDTVANAFSISGINSYYSTRAIAEIDKLKMSVTIKTSKEGNPEVTKVLNCFRLDTNYQHGII